MKECTEAGGGRGVPKLPEIICMGCARAIPSREYRPAKNGGPPRATNYESCYRRCEACGFGYSNADHGNSAALTIVYRDPNWDVPEFIASGYTKVLETALNQGNRTSKLQKFSSSNSEDLVTWTIFRHLIGTGELGTLARQVGIVSGEANEPDVLLWGVPINSRTRLRRVVIAELDSLGESPERRSEPDVILDFDKSGLIFIEVKLRSSNDAGEPSSSKWKRYLHDSEAFSDAEKARETGLYELVRNWRILCDIAHGRPAMLVNLGPDELWSGESGARIRRFEEALAINPTRRFLKVSWESFIAAIPHKPLWLRRYLEDRLVCSH